MESVVNAAVIPPGVFDYSLTLEYTHIHLLSVDETSRGLFARGVPKDARWRIRARRMSDGARYNQTAPADPRVGQEDPGLRALQLRCQNWAAKTKTPPAEGKGE